MLMRRLLAFLSVVASIQVAPAPARASRVDAPASRGMGPEHAIAVVASGEQLRIHVGEVRPSDVEATFDQVIVRDGAGQWSGPALIPGSRAGIPLVHRGMTWLLENRRSPDGGTAFHVLLPVTGELGLAGMRLEHVQDQRGAAAIQVIDDWTFLVAELGPGAHLFVRVIVSHGSTMEMEVIREGDWLTGWPRDARLIGAGEAGSMLVAMAATSTTVLGTAFDSREIFEFPPLDVSDLKSVAAAITHRGPIVVGARNNSLVARAWVDTAWGAEQRLDLPRGIQVGALAVTTRARSTGAPIGTGESAFAVALETMPTRMLSGAPLSIAEDGSVAWGALERQPMPEATRDAAIRPSVLPPDLEAVERRGNRLRLLRWGLVIAAFPILVLLLRQLARLR